MDSLITVISFEDPERVRVVQSLANFPTIANIVALNDIRDAKLRDGIFTARVTESVKE